jgi:hypothetical protein
MSENDEKPPVKEVTVRGYKPVDALSEETVAFTATIYLDGERAGEVSNHGRGGANRYHFADNDRRTAFFDYTQSWAQANGVTGEVADALIEKLCDDYELTNKARALLRLRTNTVILIERDPIWFTDEHSGAPDYYAQRELLVVPDGENPAELAAEHDAHAWRVIPTG